MVQGTFARKVQELYEGLIEQLDDVTDNLLVSRAVNRINIANVMYDGHWVKRSASNVNDLVRQVKIKILSRSLDALLERPTSNKMWLLFIDLHDKELHNAPVHRTQNVVLRLRVLHLQLL